MPDTTAPEGESIRAAEAITTLSPATDLGIGMPLEHGSQSTLFAMRLADRLNVDGENGIADVLGVPALPRRPHGQCRQRRRGLQRRRLADAVSDSPAVWIEGRNGRRLPARGRTFGEHAACPRPRRRADASYLREDFWATTSNRQLNFLPHGRSLLTYDELVTRDRASLDIFWLRDGSLQDTGNLPVPELIAAEIVEDLQAALDSSLQLQHP